MILIQLIFQIIVAILTNFKLLTTLILYIKTIISKFNDLFLGIFCIQYL
jgi:hypothetical protein